MLLKTEPALIFPGQRRNVGTRQPPSQLVVLLRVERRVRAIRPGVVLGTVVCGIHDDGVVPPMRRRDAGMDLADRLVPSQVAEMPSYSAD
jgi:hypothetical protein